MSPVRALSLRQPWAWAVLHGGKRVENRRWAGCSFRGPFLIHASKGGTRREVEAAVEAIARARSDLELPPVVVPSGLPTGCLVGVACLVDARPNAASFGYAIEGLLGLELADIRVAEPLSCRGFLNLFPVPISLLRSTSYETALRELGCNAGF